MSGELYLSLPANITIDIFLILKIFISKCTKQKVLLHIDDLIESNKSCYGNQLKYHCHSPFKIKLCIKVFITPLLHMLKDRNEAFAQIRKVIFHMRRDFLIIMAGNKAVGFQFPKLLCQA